MALPCVRVNECVHGSACEGVCERVRVYVRVRVVAMAACGSRRGGAARGCRQRSTQSRGPTIQ